ncbi:MAG: division/cell wall cluster transcriptional repressor MraZ [Patescibacteria group bacterium]
MLGSAYEIEPDNQGRIILPVNLVEYADLKENLIFLGLKDRVEIWNKDIWEEKEKEISTKASEYIEKIANETK